MDAVEQFAIEAARYRDWARNGTDQGERAAREALLRITQLYLAALHLPPPWSDELANQPDAERASDPERLAVTEACRRFPFDFYGEVFDTQPIPPEVLVVGSLSDDIGDIYRDVVTGLQEYEVGRRAQAVWEWGFGFRTHWGEHATGAIRALHCWLAANAFERLAADSEPLA